MRTESCAPDPALVRHLGDMGHFIVVRYRDGVSSVGGPFSEREAKSRAAMLFQRMPGAIGVRILRQAQPPEPTAERRWCMVGYRPRTNTRLVVGPFATRKQALERSSVILSGVPDSRIDDYEMAPFYIHTTERFPRTRRAS